MLPDLSDLRRRLDAYKATLTPGYSRDVARHRAAARAHASLGRAAVKALESLLDELALLQPVFTDLPGLHRRECLTCHRVAWYAVNRIGYIACKCGNQVTTKIEPPKPPQPDTTPGPVKPEKQVKPPREKCGFIIKTPKKGYHAYMKRTGITPRTKFKHHRCRKWAIKGGFCRQHQPDCEK